MFDSHKYKIHKLQSAFNLATIKLFFAFCLLLADLEDPKRASSSSPSAENRIDLDLDKEAPEHSIEKRTVRYLQLPLWKRKFSPWAGKRSIRPSNEEWIEQKKRNFNPWGGKRASFSAWGGKRALRTEDDDDADDRRELLRYTLKRQSFRPWGGRK